MAVNLRGVMAALLTPFDGQQKLDKESLRRLVRFNLRQGVDGLYVGGSTGEAFVQSGTERQEVLELSLIHISSAAPAFPSLYAAGA